MGSDAAAADDAVDADVPSLPKLLASLAAGARAVSSLPLAGAGDESDDDDDFSFRMSLPEFASLSHEARTSLSGLLCRALDSAASDDEGDGEDDEGEDDGGDLYRFDFDDPELWDRAADACDALQDRVGDYLASERRRRPRAGGDCEHLATALADVAGRARRRAAGSHARMLAALADMERPQCVCRGFVTRPPQNARGEAFVPDVAHDAAKRAALEGGAYAKEGHGRPAAEVARLDEDGDDVARRGILPPRHHGHPYREEIEALEHRPWQLSTADLPRADAPVSVPCRDDDRGIWIAAEEDLIALAERLAVGAANGELREVALDLEAHSHRTFAGFVCLIQLSIRRAETQPISTYPPEQPDVSSGYDFLIDALALRHCIPVHLGPLLANPDVVKVMHGADSDVPWLQRDFGIYIVNLFDTGRAARALKFPSAGLAFLLRKYAKVEAEKAHQLSDWRQRPLPDDMRSYAVSDTRYLLDIYDRLRAVLAGHSSDEVSVEAVLDRSKQVCLLRYEKPSFRPSGYLALMDGGRGRRNRGKGGRVTSDLSPAQEAALRALYDWRDATARREDESTVYVCPDAALLRIASNRPATAAALTRLVNPLPPLVMRRSQEILDAVRSAASATAVDSKRSERAEDSSGGGEDAIRAGKTSSVAAPPQQQPPASVSARNREMLSPILGSESLYQQAGWMTPAGEHGTASGSEDDKQGVQKFLDVDAANEGYAASRHPSHGIEMSPPRLESEQNDTKGSNNGKGSRRGASTDGLGTARAAVGDNAGDVGALQEEFRTAQQSASLIRRDIVRATATGADGAFAHGFSLIDLIRPVPLPVSTDPEQESDKDCTTDRDASVPEPVVEEGGENYDTAVPKSMHEIYGLSNANRRRTGKQGHRAGAQPPLKFPDGIDPNNVPVMAEDSVEGADAVIASRGSAGSGGYFGNSGTGSSKRARTAPGKEGDIKLLVKMGWVKDKADAESLSVVASDLQQQQQGGAGEANTKDGIKGSGGGNGGGGGHHGQSSQFKKTTSGGGRGNGGGGGTGGWPVDYYTGIGAFDPNAAPSKNPFFAGAATGAASMRDAKQQQGKSHKKNKKR